MIKNCSLDAVQRNQGFWLTSIENLGIRYRAEKTKILTFWGTLYGH